MEIFYKFILYPHIAGGFIALFVAPVAMAVKKGGPAHRLWGKIYFIAMCMVSLTSVTMSVLKPNIFLGMVGVFSFYLVASGYRALYRRNVNSPGQVALVDWLLVAVSGLFSLGLISFGILILLKNISHPFGYISTILGLIGLWSVVRDVLSFTKPGHHKENWMYHHMGGMIGGYIATVSAFSVVNFTFLPDLVRWLWPMAIGFPLLFKWINYYKKKKNNPSVSNAMVQSEPDSHRSAINMD